MLCIQFACTLSAYSVFAFRFEILMCRACVIVVRPHFFVLWSAFFVFNRQERLVCRMTGCALSGTLLLTHLLTVADVCLAGQIALLAIN